MGKLFNPDSPAMRFFGQVFDLILLNLLMVVFCLPVFTAGASLTAMHYVLFHKVTGDDRGVIQPFLRSFRENFRQATILWLSLLAAAGLLVLDVRIRNLDPTTLLAGRIETFLLLPCILWCMLFLYVFPILARFSNTVARTLINALTAAVVFFPRTIAMAAVHALWAIVAWNFPLRLIPLLILFGFVFPWYICAFLYRKVLLRMEDGSDP